MSPDLLATFQSNSTTIATDTLETPLDQQIITAQEDYSSYLQSLQATYHLTIDSQNCFQKDLALMLWKTTTLRGGCYILFTPSTQLGTPVFQTPLPSFAPTTGGPT